MLGGSVISCGYSLFRLRGAVLFVWLFTYLLNNSLAGERDAGSVVRELIDVSNLKLFYSLIVILDLAVLRSNSIASLSNVAVLRFTR